jgi:FAD/FMN-containing dehydrogenase
VLAVAGFGDPVVADYADYATREGAGNMVILAEDAGSVPSEKRGRVAALVLFLPRRLRARERQTLDAILDRAREGRTELVAVVSTFRAHLGDQGAAQIEEYVLARTKGLPRGAVVFRPGHLLSPRSRAGERLRRLGFLYPLVPRRLSGCCVDGHELFAAIEAVRQSPGSAEPRVYTLLGPNRPWRERLAEHGTKGVGRACLTAACALLSLLLVGHFAALLLTLLARRRPALRCCDVGTLRPGGTGELLALYNPYNYRHVKVVGYNNGVVHFGHRYPGRTVVSTVGCNRLTRVGADLLRADCGVTVRQALDYLARSGQELPVVPNYSYVALGTAFFVPIHGSAADYSTVLDTITRVTLYDPATDRRLEATRAEPAFGEHAYDLSAEVLLLDLDLRVKPKSRYFVERQALQEPGSEELLAALRDARPTNVEIRKSRASARPVTVSRYYKDPGDTTARARELPRDALGRLWDRLEENPVTSYLMHALTRHLAWHVELFFTAEEFATFWRTHPALPLRKLQLRYIRRDGLPRSPFRDHDCVAVDLFLLRRHRRRFEAYLQNTFPAVRTNPGKHSR